VATAGIWRPIRLESWSGVRIDSVRPLAGVNGDSGILDTRLALAWAPGADDEVTATVRVGGAATGLTVPAGTPSAVVTVSVPDVHLWWPRGYGDQPLYDVSVTLTGVDSELGTWQGRVGFRTVTLDTAPDEHGSPFVLAVNNRPVYIRGASPGRVRLLNK